MAEIFQTGKIIDLSLNEDEKTILINLIEQLLELLGEVDHHAHHISDDPLAKLLDFNNDVLEPEDEVLRRLLPNGYVDESDALEFRKYTQDTIKREKQSNATLIRGILLVASQDHQELLPNFPAEKFLQLLNDIRIALGVRLKIEPTSFDKFEKMPDSAEEKGVYAVYFWLSGLQENLINKLELVDLAE
jgi:hypothetical protein